MRNEKYYDCVVDALEQLKLMDNVEVNEDYGGETYFIRGYDYILDRNYSDILSIDVYKIDQGTEYVLRYRSSHIDGLLTVTRTGDNIRIKRDFDFKDGDESNGYKPMNADQIRNYLDKGIIRMHNHDYIISKLGEDKNNIEKLHSYLDGFYKKDIEDMTKFDLDQVLKYSQNVVEVDSRDLYDLIMKKFYDCEKDELLYKLLSKNIRDKDYFVYDCVENGIPGPSYYGKYSRYNTKFYKVED